MSEKLQKLVENDTNNQDIDSVEAENGSCLSEATDRRFALNRFIETTDSILSISPPRSPTILSTVHEESRSSTPPSWTPKPDRERLLAGNDWRRNDLSSTISPNQTLPSLLDEKNSPVVPNPFPLTDRRIEKKRPNDDRAADDFNDKGRAVDSNQAKVEQIVPQAELGPYLLDGSGTKTTSSSQPAGPFNSETPSIKYGSMHDDILKLMEHLTIRDAQRSARDSEILVEMVRQAAELRNAYEDLKNFPGRFGQPALPKMTRASEGQHQNSATYASAGGTVMQFSPQSNVWRRALTELKPNGDGGLIQIEEELAKFVEQIEDLKKPQTLASGLCNTTPDDRNMKSKAGASTKRSESAASIATLDGSDKPRYTNITSYRTEIHDRTESTTKTGHAKGIKQSKVEEKQYFMSIDDDLRHSNSNNLAKNSAATRNVERSIVEAHMIDRSPNVKIAGDSLSAPDPSTHSSVNKLEQQPVNRLAKNHFLNDPSGILATRLSGESDNQSSSDEDTPLRVPHKEKSFRAFKTREPSRKSQRSRRSSNEVHTVENMGVQAFAEQEQKTDVSLRHPPGVFRTRNSTLEKKLAPHASNRSELGIGMAAGAPTVEASQKMNDSYQARNDGSQIMLSTKGPMDRKISVAPKQQSQTSLLIKYFEGSKTGDQSKRPSVRVKVSPRSATLRSIPDQAKDWKLHTDGKEINTRVRSPDIDQLDDLGAWDSISKKVLPEKAENTAAEVDVSGKTETMDVNPARTASLLSSPLTKGMGREHKGRNEPNNSNPFSEFKPSSPRTKVENDIVEGSVTNTRRIRKMEEHHQYLTVPTRLKALAKGEGSYMRDLRILLDAVIPALLAKELSTSTTSTTSSSTKDILGSNSVTPDSKSIVDVGISLERLHSRHKRIPLQDTNEFIDWASEVYKAYDGYVAVWQAGYREVYKDIVVNLAEYDERKPDSDLARTAQFDMTDEVLVDVAYLLRRPLQRARSLAKTIKVCKNDLPYPRACLTSCRTSQSMDHLGLRNPPESISRTYTGKLSLAWMGRKRHRRREHALRF